MPKFFGKIGYAISTETKPGVYEEQIIERSYKGDIIKESRSLENGESINDNIRIKNRISIVADAFAYQHYSKIRYVIVYGVKWKVSEIDVERPRMIFTLGAEYNGE